MKKMDERKLANQLLQVVAENDCSMYMQIILTAMAEKVASYKVKPWKAIEEVDKEFNDSSYTKESNAYKKFLEIQNAC